MAAFAFPSNVYADLITPMQTEGIAPMWLEDLDPFWEPVPLPDTGGSFGDIDAVFTTMFGGGYPPNPTTPEWDNMLYNLEILYPLMVDNPTAFLYAVNNPTTDPAFDEMMNRFYEAHDAWIDFIAGNVYLDPEEAHFEPLPWGYQLSEILYIVIEISNPADNLDFENIAITLDNGSSSSFNVSLVTNGGAAPNTLPAGEMLEIEVSPQPGLPVGMHTDTIIITGTAGNTSDIIIAEIPVEFQVLHPLRVEYQMDGTGPFVSWTGDTVNFSGIDGYAEFRLANISSQEIYITAANISGSDSDAFILIDFNEYIDPNDIIYFDVNIAANLSVGTYEAIINLNIQQSVPNINIPISVTIPLPPSVSITISPATPTVQRGGTQQFTANVANLPPTGVSPAVTWSVNGLAATTISNTGLLTVAAGETATTLTVTATLDYDEDITATAIVTVTAPPPPAIEISITPQTATVQRGSTQQFTAVITNLPTGADNDITWSVGGASGTTITAAGLLTVASDETAETLTVRAVLDYDEDVFDTAAVTVTVPEPEPTPAPTFRVTILDTHPSSGGERRYAVGETVHINAGLRQGFSFWGWRIVEGSIASGNFGLPSSSFTMPSHDVTIMALWVSGDFVGPGLPPNFPSGPDLSWHPDWNPDWTIMLPGFNPNIPGLQSGATFNYNAGNFPVMHNAISGSSLTFTLRVHRNLMQTAPLTGQWLRNGEAHGGIFSIPINAQGFADVVLNLPNIRLHDAGEYTLRLSSVAAGSVTHVDISRAMTLTVDGQRWVDTAPAATPTPGPTPQPQPTPPPRPTGPPAPPNRPALPSPPERSHTAVQALLNAGEGIVISMTGGANQVRLHGRTLDVLIEHNETLFLVNGNVWTAMSPSFLAELRAAGGSFIGSNGGTFDIGISPSPGVGSLSGAQITFATNINANISQITSFGASYTVLFELGEFGISHANPQRISIMHRNSNIGGILNAYTGVMAFETYSTGEFTIAVVIS